MPSKIIKSVMVLGASGSVGPPIVEALLAGGFAVSVLTRASSKAIRNDVNVVRTDYSHDSLAAAFANQDAVVSTIATFSTDQHVKIINAAIAAKVQRFLSSEFGIDTSSSQIIERLPPAGAKRKTVTYLKPKESTGLTWTGVIVGAFFDWAYESVPSDSISLQAR